MGASVSLLCWKHERQFVITLAYNKEEGGGLYVIGRFARCSNVCCFALILELLAVALNMAISAAFVFSFFASTVHKPS